MAAEGTHLTTLYPELAAGGFTRVDGTIAFYSRVQALLGERGEATVVDLGAGRGAHSEDPVSYRRRLHDLRGTGRRVIGVDVDVTVLKNSTVDESLVVVEGNPLPLADASIDVVVSDFTFEHVCQPEWLGGELARIVGPGGWVCARTPNKWGYIGLGARLVPNAVHVSALRRLQPGKAAYDTFPTAYLLNTPASLKCAFADVYWDRFVWASDSEPRYVGHSKLAASAFRAVAALTPSICRSMLFAFFRRR